MKSIFAVAFTLLNFLLLASAAATPNGRDWGNPNCAQCDPNPNFNKCDITTSCITTEPSKQYHCACRAGYKAAPPANPNDQYRLHFVGQEYRVFVAPGVVCNTLCDIPYGVDSCKEVPVNSQCNP